MTKIGTDENEAINIMTYNKGHHAEKSTDRPTIKYPCRKHVRYM